MSTTTHAGRARRRSRLLAALVTATAMTMSMPALMSSAHAAVASPVIDEAATVAGPTGDVTLAWSAVEGATGYKVDVSASQTFDTILYTATTPALRATPKVVLPQGTIYWRVTTIEATLQSAPVTASFQRSVIAGPVVLGPGANGTVEVLHYPAQPPVLAWEPVPAAKSYTVELSTDDTFPTGSTVVTTPATSHAVTTLLARGPIWYWRVMATLTDNGVTTQYSRVSQFKIEWPGSQPVLGGPAAGDLALAAPYITDIDLSWSPVSGATRYKVYAATDPNFTTVVPGTPVTVMSTRFSPARSWDNGRYYWKVSAIDPAGNEGPPSETRHFQRVWGAGSDPAPTSTELAAPAVVSPTSGEVSLSDFRLVWAAVPRASVYEVWFTSETSNFFTDSAKILKCYTPHTTMTAFDLHRELSAHTWIKDSSPTGCLDKLGRSAGWPLDATFRWRVRALDLAASDTASHTSPGLTDGNSRFIRSGWSDRNSPDNPASVTVTAGRSEAAGLTPTLLAPEGCATSCPDTPELAWTPVADALAGYWIEIALDEEFSNKIAEFHTLSARLRMNGDLIDNSQAYYWRVMGCSSFSSFDTKSCLQSGSANKASFIKQGKAPAVLTSSSSADHVTLSWQEQLLTESDGGGNRGYEVQVSSDEQFSTVPVFTATVDQPFVTTALSLLQDGAYFWRVRVLDGVAVASAWANGGTVTKSAVKTVQQNTLSGASPPVLRWDAVPGTASYQVQIFNGATLSTGGSQALLTTGINATAYVPAPLAPGLYSWRVRRVDAKGNILPWNTDSSGDVKTFTIGAGKVALLAPPAEQTVNLSSRVLTWESVPGAVKYRVQVSTSPSFGTTLENVDTVQSRLALVSGSYLANTTYYWRVLPLNGANAVLTLEQEARPILFFTAPSVPTSVKAVASGKDIAVTWAAPTSNGGSPVTGYVIRYRPLGIEEWSRVAVSDVTSRTLSGLEPGTTYEVRVAAVTNVGTGAFSGVVKATTGGVPSAPTLTGVTPGDRSASLTWTAPTTTGGSSITGYQISATPGGHSFSVGASALSAEMTGLTGGETYTFSVAAFNTNGAGDPAVSAPTIISPFVDVSVNHGFFGDILWMFQQKISTGTLLDNGAREYRPVSSVSRSAMSAFLYRASGSPVFTGPSDPTFADVPVNHSFYGEIEWMAAQGISIGYANPDGGKPLYKPVDPVSRQAMSAFLYRAAGKPAFTAPAEATFADVPADHNFFLAIEWMAANGISKGTAQPTGKPLYKPGDAVSRQAMAAFLHRYDAVPKA